MQNLRWDHHQLHPSRILAAVFCHFISWETVSVCLRKTPRKNILYFSGQTCQKIAERLICPMSCSCSCQRSSSLTLRALQDPRPSCPPAAAGPQACRCWTGCRAAVKAGEAKEEILVRDSHPPGWQFKDAFQTEPKFAYFGRSVHSVIYRGYL